VATRLIVTAIVLVAAAAVPSMLVVSASFLAHVPIMGTGIAWCTQMLGIHAEVPTWLGVVATAAVVSGAWHVGRVVRCRRRLTGELLVGRGHRDAVEVIREVAPIACTLPGRHGRVVISTGMLDLLRPEELDVVLAHERAHADHRHDRVLLVSELAAALVPPLRWLAARALFSVERWADEAAVRACGGDRRLVAETLARVALHTAQPAGALGIASSAPGLGVAARVDVLIRRSPRSVGRGVVGGLWVGMAGVALLSATQIHHLAGLATSLCPH
jgi:Zn-dependent protease with chaperone function